MISNLLNTDKKTQIISVLNTGYTANLARKTAIKSLNITTNFLAGMLSPNAFYDQLIGLGYTQEDIERYAVELVQGIV